MLLIDPQGNYPRYYGDVMNEVNGWTFGDPLPEGWLQVTEVEVPEIADNQLVYEESPQQIDGVWTQQWVIRDLTEQEIADRKIAHIRHRVAIGEPITAEEALLLVG